MSGATLELCRSCNFEEAEIHLCHMDTRPTELAFTSSPPQHSHFQPGIQGLQQSRPRLPITTASVLHQKPPHNP